MYIYNYLKVIEKINEMSEKVGLIYFLTRPFH